MVVDASSSGSGKSKVVLAGKEEGPCECEFKVGAGRYYMYGIFLGLPRVETHEKICVALLRESVVRVCASENISV